MKLRDAFAAGFAHLSQNRLRAGLSILGILIGIASVLCMMAIGDGAKKIIADDIDTLGGANQFQFVTRTAIYRNGRFIRRTRERLNICIPLSTYRQRVSGRDYVERLTVFFKAGADIEAVIASARAVIRKRHRNRDEFAYSWTARWTVKRLTHIEKVIKIALGSIAGFSLFVSGIGIMNICLVSVGEKTREIGLRKSVGAKRSDIFWQFLTESVCLCLCGGISGIGYGWLAAHGMAQLAVRIVPIVPKWPVVLSGLWILISVIFSIFMGVGFGVYPAMRAARLTPIEALRTEK